MGSGVCQHHTEAAGTVPCKWRENPDVWMANIGCAFDKSCKSQTSALLYQKSNTLSSFDYDKSYILHDTIKAGSPIWIPYHTQWRSPHVVIALILRLDRGFEFFAPYLLWPKG